jgi:hypothetical protein
MGLLYYIFAGVIALLVLVRELSAPVDQKWLSGRKWKLPPGPKGSVIMGNLGQFFNARASGKMIPWVRRCHP